MPPPSCCAVARQLRWCGWQPHSLLYWGALMQLVGAILFIVGCFAQLPCFEPPSHEGLVWLLYVPSTVASSMFVFASYVYVVEVTHSYNICALPEVLSIGYAVSLLNFVGSVFFLIASACYFVQAPPWPRLDPWEWYASEWGVRFTFAIGSLAFTVAALLGLREALAD